MKSVDIPGVGTVDFPDEMSDKDIGHTIDKEIMPQVAERKRIDDYWAGRGSQEDAGDGRPGILDQFGNDLSRGVSQMQQLGYGLGGLAADAVGADETAKSWLQSYQDVGRDIQENNPPTIGSYTNIHGFEDILRYGVEAIGENALMAVPSLLTGGAGALVGRSIAEKGVAGFVESQVAKGVAREVAEKQATSYLAKTTALSGAAGAYPPAAGMEMGSIYGDVYEQTGVQAPGTAVTLGAIAGALDVVGEGLALRRVFGRELSETATRSLVSRLGIAGAEQFVTEAPTEALQTILERTGVALQDPSKAVFSQQGIEEIINAGLKGGIGGAGVGVVAESAGSIMDWAKRRGVAPTQENLQNAAAAGDTQAIEILKASGVMSDEQLANLSPEAAERFAARYQGRRAAEEDPILAAQRTQEAIERRDLEGGDTLPNQRPDRIADQGGNRREDILKTYDIATRQVDAAIEAGQVKPEQREAAIRERAVGLMPELDRRAQADARTVAAARARINDILAMPASAHTPDLATEYLELNNLVEQSERKGTIQLGQARVDGKLTAGSTEDPGLGQAVDLRGRPNLPVPLAPSYVPHTDEEIAHQRALMRRQGRTVNAGVDVPSAPGTEPPPTIRSDAPTPVVRDGEGFAAPGRTARETEQLRIQAENNATGLNQMVGSDDRLPRTLGQDQEQRKAEQGFRLAEHLATKAGPDVRDVRAGGRPEGGIESQGQILLDEGRPVKIVETRTEPRGDGTTRTIHKVHRYDPRTGKAQTDENGEAFEYEVDARALTVGKYAADPRRAQEMEEAATPPMVGKRRADEVLGLPRQTYRETAPDPAVPGVEGPASEVPGRGPVPRSPRPAQGEGPRVDMGSNKRGGEFRGDFTGAEAAARRAEAVRRAKMREQSQRSQTQDEKTGEQTEWGKARSKYGNQADGYSSTAKGVDEDGWPLTDDDGFVLSDAGGPIRFEHKKDTTQGEETKVGVLTVLKAMRKQHPDAHLNPVAHPGPMRRTGATSAEAYWTIQATQPKPGSKTGQEQTANPETEAAPEQPAQTGPQRTLPGLAPTPDPTPGPDDVSAPETPWKDTGKTPETPPADTENTPVRNPEQLVAGAEKALRDRQVKPTPKAIARHLGIDEGQAANVLATIAGRSNKVIRQARPSRKELAAALRPKEGAEAPAPKGPRYRLAPQFDEDMSLLEFLMSKGGLAANGDLTAMDAHKKSHPRYGNLVRKQGGGGLSLDEARELAEGEGYIGGTDDYNTATIPDLLEAIEDELRGTRVTAERAGSGSERDQMEARARELGVDVNPDWNDAELMVEIGEADAIANEDNPTVQAADNLREVVDAMLVEMGIVPDTYSADFDIPFGDERAGPDQGAGEVGAEVEGAAETAVDGAGRQAPDVRPGGRAPASGTGDAQEAGGTGRQTPAIERTDQGDQYVLINQASGRDGKKAGKGPRTKADEGLFAKPAEPEPEQIDLEDAIAAAKVDEKPAPAKGTQGKTPEEAAANVVAKKRRDDADRTKRTDATNRWDAAVEAAKGGKLPPAALLKGATRHGDGRVVTGEAKQFLLDMGLTAKQADQVIDETRELDATSGGALIYDLARIVRTGQDVLDVAKIVNDVLKTVPQKAETPKPKKPPKRKERAALLSRLFGRDLKAELTAEREAADEAAWQERLEQIAPRAETVADIERILDENVERGILNKGTAKGIKAILARMPVDGLKGVRLMVRDRMTAGEREILGTAKGVSGEYITLADDADTRVLTVLGENGSKDAVETFVHENAHVLFDMISEPDKALARQIHDRLPISRQALHTVGYDKEARFEEWFAESAVDHYAAGPRAEGPRAGIPHMLGGLMQRLFKRIVDAFSNEKAQVAAFFSGLERSLGYSGPVSVEGITRRERRGVSTLAILSNPIGAVTGDWKAWRSGFQDLRRDVTETWKNPRPNRQNAAAGLARWFFYSADGEYRAAIGKFNSPTLNMLADTFHAKAGSRQGLDSKLAGKLGMKLDSNATFDESVTRKVGVELNQLSRILKPFEQDAAAMDRIVDLVQKPASRRSDPESKAASEIARQLASLHKYMTDSGVDVGQVKDGYFPREIDVAAVIKNHAGFVTQATKAYQSSGLGAKEAKEAADRWLTTVLFGGSGSPVRDAKAGAPNFVQSRVLTKEADEILKEFYQRDPGMVLGSYISRAVKRAEIARRFGDNWKNWENIEKQIREEDPAAAGMLDLVSAYAATAAGVRQDAVSGLVRQGSSMVRTITSVSLLEKSTLTSLGEAVMPAIRTGSLLDVIPTIGKTLREFRRDLAHMPPSVAAELAADIGAIAGSGVNSLMAARFAGGDPLGRGQARVLSKYFRRIGQEQWTNATRVAATERGAIFIRRLAGDIAGKGWSPKASRVYMEEMGVPAGQIDQFVKYVNGFGNDLPTPSDLDKGGEMGAAYRTALLRFVDQAIMRPTTTTKPRWASHPVGAVLFQLQAFNYAFAKNAVLRNLQLAKTAATPSADLDMRDRLALAYPVIMMLPLLGITQLIVGELRDRLFMDPERRKAQTSAARFEKAISRTGLLGALDPYVQMISGARYQKDPISALTGPFLGVLGSGLGAAQQMMGNNSPNTNAAERRASEALYDTVFEPMVNIVLGYSPASPLATLVTMGLIPGLRDDFVDSVAGPRIGHKQQPIYGVTEILAGKQFKDKAGSWAAGG